MTDGLLRLLVCLAAWAAGEALRFGSQDDLPGSALATAICIVGNARTLPRPEVHTSLRGFVAGLNATGLVRSRQPDVFGYVTLQGAGPKGQKDWNFKAASATKDQVGSALAPTNPVRVVTVEQSDEVTPENIDRYVVHRECFRGVYYDKNPDALRRTLNQLAHWQHCLDLVVEQEKMSLQKYGVVILARPDLAYTTGVSRHIDLRAVQAGNALTNADKVMFLPRKVAGLLLSETRARPLRCDPGQPCCSAQLDRSEKIWEYLTGVCLNVAFKLKVMCGPSAASTGPLKVTHLSYFARIVRPERVGELPA